MIKVLRKEAEDYLPWKKWRIMYLGGFDHKSEGTKCGHKHLQQKHSAKLLFAVNDTVLANVQDEMIPR